MYFNIHSIHEGLGGGSHYSLFIIFWLLNHSLLSIHYKKGHYSLIIIPYPDPQAGFC